MCFKHGEFSEVKSRHFFLSSSLKNLILVVAMSDAESGTSERERRNTGDESYRPRVETFQSTFGQDVLDFVETSSATEGTPQEVNDADDTSVASSSVLFDRWGNPLVPIIRRCRHVSSFDSLVTVGECDKLHFVDCPDLQSALSDPRNSRIKEHRICGCVFELQTGREIYKASSNKKLHASMWCRDFGRGFDATYQVCKSCIP